MPRCKMCGGDIMITLDNVCLICNPPTEKEIDTISTIMVLTMEHIKDMRNSEDSGKGTINDYKVLKF